jgi:hypothetical protein
MPSLAARLKVIAPGVAAGALLLAWYCVDGLPSTWGLGQRFEAWALMMSGPVLSLIFGMSYSPEVLGITIAVLSVAILAHPIRPHVVTAIVTLVALSYWFFAGFVTMIAAVWGA